MRRAQRGMAAAILLTGLGLLWPATGAAPVATPSGASGAAPTVTTAAASAAQAGPAPAGVSAGNATTATPPSVTVPSAASAGTTPMPAPATTSGACPVSPDHVTNFCLPDPDPLAFEKTAITNLPAARVDVAYTYRFLGTGGEPPYVFSEVGTGLPDGLTLDANGNVRGIAAQPGRRTFTVELRDRWGQGVRQQFAINVTGPRSSRSAPKLAPTIVPVIQNVPIAATQTPLRSRTQIDTWRITDALLEKIVPPPPPEAGSEPAAEVGGETTAAAPAPVAGATAVAVSTSGTGATAVSSADSTQASATDGDGLDELSDAGAAQLVTLIKPLLNVDYPTRALFTAALDTRVCAYAAALTSRVALETSQNAPTADQWQQRCATAWQGPPPKSPPQLSEAPVKWQDLPATLMPPRVRAWLVDQAIQPHDATIGSPPPWSGTGCNCLIAATSGAVYGFVPNWSDSKQGPKLDFSLYERLMGFAQPFDDDGNVTPLQPDAAQLDFLRAVHRYGSKLDVTIYRKDWQFLLHMPEDQRRRVAEQVARQAMRMIDVPLRQYETRWEDRLPAVASDSHVGDGITLFLDQAPRPGDPRYAAFDDFRHRLIQTLIAEMRRSKRHYTLNLMFPASDLVPTLRKPDERVRLLPVSAAAATQRKGGAPASAPAAPAAANSDPGSAVWTFNRLFDYLVQAEDPPYQDGRIVVGAEGYRSRTNVTLRYVVALPEPTTQSKKVLRDAVENTADLAGTNRAIVVRRVLPLVSIGSADARQMRDDMAYFNDNFGGVALWPQPAADAVTSQLVESAVRSTMLAGETREGALCNVVCDGRWVLRAAFWLLLAIATISLALYVVSCRVRALGRPYQLYLLVAGLVPLVIGGLLLRCDPDLASADLSNRLLFLVLAAVIITMLIPLLKPRVQKP